MRVEAKIEVTSSWCFLGGEEYGLAQSRQDAKEED
jgi:hypothetical protein